MKFIKYIVLLMMVSTALNAQHSDFQKERGERDEMVVRDFVESKELIDLEEKDTNLDISGDVRFELHRYDEWGDEIVFKGKSKDKGVFYEKFKRLRGGHVLDTEGFPVSNYDWDVEFNLKFKYTYKNAWAAAHLQFDNSAGAKGHNKCFGVYDVNVIDPDDFSEYCKCRDCCCSSDDEEIEIILIRDNRSTCKGSGESNSINLKRAYMGYTIWADGVHRWDIELGRRKLNDVFISEIQFGTRFDGILLKYATAIEDFADFYGNGAFFIIDERVNHYGFVGEIGLLNIYDTGFDIRYSLIDWRKRGKNRCFVHDAIGTEFLNSQISFSYNVEYEFCNKQFPTEYYGGFLINHAARSNMFTRHRGKKNLGWYCGVYIGEVEKKGDWAIDIEYMYVQAQAASDCDVDGIGRGNINDNHFTDIILLPDDAKGCGIEELPESKIYGSSGDLDVFSEFFSEFLNDDESSGSSSSFEFLPVSESFSSSDERIKCFIPRQGNANFTGGRIEMLYAITDNFSLDAQVEFSVAADRHIGGRHYYSNYELEAIYAF